MNKILESFITTNLSFEYISGNIATSYKNHPIQCEWIARPYDVISCVVAGCMEIHTANKKMFLEAGDCMFMPSGQLRRATFLPVNNKCVRLYMNFNYICLNSINFLSLFTISNLFKEEHGKKLQILIKSLHEVNKKTDISTIKKHIKTKELGFAILYILIQNAEMQTTKANILCHHNRLSKLLELIKETPETTRTISEMAQIVGVSPSRLYQLFRELTGYAPLQYVQIQRLQKAMQLLLTTDLSIAEIAQKLNYSDQFWFSKSYKKFFGASPSAYKKEGRHWE